MIRNLLVFGFLSLIHFTSAGQASEILEQFTLRQVGDEIRVDAGIKGGASCLGITLERLVNDNFEAVDEIGGVCGGSEFTEYYVLYDQSPVPNAYNIYRLRLGFSGLTHTSEILFVPPTGGMVLYPNPTTTWIDLKWDEIVSDATLDIFHPDGRLQSTFSDISGTEIRVFIDGLTNGLYVIQLRAGQEVVGRKTVLVVD
jgi:hypothetical protein